LSGQEYSTTEIREDEKQAPTLFLAVAEQPEQRDDASLPCGMAAYARRETKPLPGGFVDVGTY
jgi:hypothetical protein